MRSFSKIVKRALSVSVLYSAFVCTGIASEPLRVASFNPIMTDLVRQVGGDYVLIDDLLEPGTNPHHFSPTPSDYKKASEADLVVFAGKGLEPWLTDLASAIASDRAILEVGRKIPSLRISESDALFACCPSHAHGAVDPHWWHSIKNMRRASVIVERRLSELRPEQHAYYAKRAKEYRGRLDELYKWAETELSAIPASRRKLATAHAAFNYFCREFRFHAVPVQGLSTQDQPTPAHLKKVLDTLHKEDVPVVFPEVATNAKVFEGIQNQTGIKVGGHLLAGTPPVDNPTYEEMVKHNINTIVAALTDLR